MARENQGLQIALIVFVMFTIILGVTTFMFSKEYTKAKAAEEGATAKAAEEAATAKELQSENNRLKVVVGHAEVATLSEVDEQFNTDMQTFAQNYNPADPNYRIICQWLFDEVQRKNSALSAEKARVQKYKDDIAVLEDTKQKQVAKFEDEAKKAQADLAQRMAAFEQALVKSRGIEDTLTKSKKKAETERGVIKADLELAIANKTKELNNQGTLIAKLYDTIDKLDPAVVEQPDGLVVHVDRNRTVSINLGRADGLSRLTNFAVFAKDMTDVTTAGRKGAIEVIALDDHSAVAQIIDDSDSNPILPGDKIFTPLWKPGQREHFALTCGMDLNDDNRSDIDELRNLITGNGGVVDFYLDDAGNKYGQMTEETDYLIIGERPTDGSTTERINARKAVITEQKRLNIRTMSLEEMLNRMGYKRQVHVVRYDSKANPNDFRAKAPEGVPRESSGRVSDLFEKRNPPKPVSSAY
jgi:hypothetical protein